MSEEKFAVNISGKDVMRVVEPASSSTPQQATTSTKKPTASAKKPTASTKKPAAATQKPIPTVKSANAMNGTRIDVNALLSASAANPQASASTTQPIFANKESTEKVKVYGDFKQFTEKLQPKPLQLAGKEMFQVSSFNSINSRGFQQMQQRNDRQAFNFNGPSGNPIVDSSNGYQKTYGNHVLNKPLDLNELREDFDFSGNLALFRKVVFDLYFCFI
jgi:hypothetical protein